MKEQDYQRKIVKLLEDRGAYVIKVIVGNKKGIPDIIALCHGRYIAIEVKTPSTMNTVSKLQEFNLKEINDAGGIAIVAWSVDRVEEILDELKDDK